MNTYLSDYFALSHETHEKGRKFSFHLSKFWSETYFRHASILKKLPVFGILKKTAFLVIRDNCYEAGKIY